MFIVVLGVMALILTGGIYWLSGKVLSLYGVSINRRSIRMVRIGAAFFLSVLSVRWRMIALAALHLIAVSAIMEAAAFAVRRIYKNRKKGRGYRMVRNIYHSCLVPVLAVSLLLGYGYYNMGRIVQTDYTIESDKLKSDYNIVLITDSHYDTVQHPDVLKRAVREINALKPDMIVLGGDIVEEGTSKKSMQEAFEVLGSLKSRFGTYYVYGNHDRQFYSDTPAYTEAELEQAIEENGIMIIDDRSVSIGDDLILAGREDAGNPADRISSRDLLKDADKERFIIVADHQPMDTSELAEQGADLELSGHTHAGQIFPVGYLLKGSGAFTYGKYKVNDLTLIVSSGVTGWGFPIRTQEKCEYAVVHLKKQY